MDVGLADAGQDRPGGEGLVRRVPDSASIGGREGGRAGDALARESLPHRRRRARSEAPLHVLATDLREGSRPEPRARKLRNAGVRAVTLSESPAAVPGLSPEI